MVLVLDEMDYMVAGPTGGGSLDGKVRGVKGRGGGERERKEEKSFMSE